MDQIILYGEIENNFFLKTSTFELLMSPFELLDLCAELLNLILPRCGCKGVEGVAGTLEALRRKLEVLLTEVSSLPNELSIISLSVLPLYLNFVPQENKPPPVTTALLSDPLGKLKTKESSDKYWVVRKVISSL